MAYKQDFFQMNRIKKIKIMVIFNFFKLKMLQFLFFQLFNEFAIFKRVNYKNNKFWRYKGCSLSPPGLCSPEVVIWATTACPIPMTNYGDAQEINFKELTKFAVFHYSFIYLCSSLSHRAVSEVSISKCFTIIKNFDILLYLHI